MRISLGNFGTTVAQPEQAAQVRTDTSTAQALGNVGQVGMKIAGDLQASKEVKDRMQAASTLATVTNDLHDIHDQVGKEVMDGTVKADDAIQVYQTRVADTKKTRLEGLNPEQLQVIDSHLITASGKLERNLQGVIIKRNQGDVGAGLLTMGESLQRAAMRDLPGAIGQWDQAVDAMGPQAGWDPVKITEAKQRFKEGAAFNLGNATLEGAAQTGNIEMVRAARAKLEGPDGEMLDPAKRVTLITKAYAYENGILASNQREAEKASREQLARENAAVDVYNKAFDLASQGRFLSLDAINELTTAATGTKMAGPVLELVKSQSKVAGFASLSLPQQQTQLERMRAAGSDPAIGVNPIEQQTQNQLTKIHEASVRAYQENPWQAAQERGVIKDAPTIALNSVQDAQTVLAQRMKEIRQVEVAAGRKISPLQPQEAETVGRMVRAMPPDQQSAALASFGSMLGDGDRISALAAQIDRKDKVLGTAMMFANSQTTQGRYVSELVLKGERAIRDKSILVDDKREVGWRGAIAKEIGDAYPNQEVRDRMIEAAYYVQAGFAAEGGSTDISRAVRMTAGRIVERNGSKFPLPYGMEEGDFDKRLKAIQPGDIAGQAPGGQVFVGKTAVPVDQFLKSLPDAALVHAGQGRYNVRAGMGLVTNAQGQRITVGVGK